MGSCAQAFILRFVQLVAQGPDLADVTSQVPGTWDLHASVAAAHVGHTKFFNEKKTGMLPC